MKFGSCLHKARMDRSDFETIAKAAVAAQDRLERDVSRMKKSWQTQREETESATANCCVKKRALEPSIKLESAMSYTVASTFYEDDAVCIIDVLLRDKLLRDDDMMPRLSLPAKQLRRTLQLLLDEHIVKYERGYDIIIYPPKLYS
jgi:TFIIE alpha subunit